MDYLGQDFSLTSEYDDMSVDAILAEFRAQQREESAARAVSADSGRRSAQPKKTRGEHLSMPSKHRNKKEKQRRRPAPRPEEAAEALSYTGEQPSPRPSAPAPTAVLDSPVESIAPAPASSEDTVDAPAAAEDVFAASVPSARVFRGAAAALERRSAEESAPAPAEPAAPAAVRGDTPRKSARPSDAEVQDFLSAFRRGDFLDLSRHELTNPPTEPDERFYMGGVKTGTMQYDGVDVDMSADENYTAPSAPSYISSYTRERDEDDEAEPEEPLPPLAGVGAKLSGLLKRPGSRRRTGAAAAVKEKSAPVEQPSAPRADEAGFESSFSDFQEGDYAVRREFEPEKKPDYDDLYDEAANPGTFKEYLLARLTAFLYSFRRGSGAGARTMEDTDEDLGREVPVARASKYYGSYIRSMRLRLQISGVLLFFMLWISLGLPVPGQLRTSVGANAVLLGFQLGIMILCLDVVTTAVMNTVRGKFGADSMAVAACIITSLDALLAAKAGIGSTHLSLCLLSSLSLAGEMFAAVLHARAMRKALRVPAIGKRCFAVTGETDPKTGEITVLKSVRPPLGFVRRSEQSSPDEDLFRKISLPLLALAFVLSFVVAFAKHDFADFVYIFSVLLCPAAPFAAMCCYSLPFFLGSMRIFPSGAAIAGWSGMSDIGMSRNLIVTDRDLFPDGTVEIGTIRIFADEDPSRIISYAGSMMLAAGSCSAPPFGDLMQRNGCRTRTVENFEYLAGGGMKGVVDSRVILCGSTDLMRLMNVRIPYRLVDKTSVLLAVDGILCGIFNMKYTAKPQVREALIDLMRSNRHPVFAIRDFNVTPEMLHVAFDVATDGYDFPPYVDRFDMSSAEPSEDSQIAAVICREGLGPLVHTADTARSMYSATRINTVLTALSALAGVLLAALRLLGAGSVPIAFLFAFMLVFALITAVVSFFNRI